MLSIARISSRKYFGLLGLAFLAGVFLAVPSMHVPWAAEGPVQKTFDTPDKAAKSLIKAAKTNDVSWLLAVLGPDAKDLVSSGNEAEDREARMMFVRAAKEKNMLVPGGTDKYVLNVGKNDWPFPIPIVKEGESWHFDTRAGKEELMNRMVGRNELHTVQVCRAYVYAQREYFAKDRDGDGILEYAQQIASNQNKMDGLSWETANTGAEPPPAGPMLAAASVDAAPPMKQPVPYHGYFFKILKEQGKNAPGGEKSYQAGENMTLGFALLAYPARYGVSGVTSFLVNQQGIVFEKDLGEKTEEVGKGITKYDPDESWRPVE
jgi:hypothetical protein